MRIVILSFLCLSESCRAYYLLRAVYDLQSPTYAGGLGHHVASEERGIRLHMDTP